MVKKLGFAGLGNNDYVDKKVLFNCKDVKRDHTSFIKTDDKG